MDEATFARLMDEELDVLRDVLQVPLPHPVCGTTNALVLCLNQMLTVYYNYDDAHSDDATISNKEIRQQEQQWTKKRDALKREFLSLSSSSSLSLPYDHNDLFENKSNEEIKNHLQDLLKQTQQSAIVLQVEQIQNKEHEKVKRDISAFKALADSML